MNPRPNRANALLVALLVAACNVSEPSGAPATSGVPGASSAAGSSAPPPSGAPGIVGADATSGDLITAAYEAGTLDRATALLHRLQAAAGDDRLPVEFRGAAGSRAEEDGASSLVLAEWATFTDAQRDAFTPYVVRPTDPRSVWAPAATAVAARVLLANHQPPVTAAGCVDGFLREQVPGIPVVVWGQCGGSSESRALAKVEEVVAYISDLWGPMTDLMGDPLGDANDPNDRYPDPPEGADGLLDIYVVESSLSAHGRQLSNAALASTYAAPPFVGPARSAATSSYIVVDGGAQGGDALRSTMAHEFFHSLQYAHNNIGTMYGSNQAGWSRHWFIEASATWSEHRFVPAGRATEVYPRFSGDFQQTSRALASVAGDNEYASWVWPYFMAQENGPESIGAVWRDLEGVIGFDAAQETLERELSFTDRFRDFAVRAWNIDLQPGDAIDPLFQADDPAFPDDVPSGPRLVSDIAVPVGGPIRRSVDLPALWAQYTDLIPDADARTVEFDFSGVTPADALDVDLLIRTEDGWLRRDGDDGPICNAKEIIVVMVNHEPVGNVASGTWTVTGRAEPCSDANWSITLEGAKAGAGSYSGRDDDIYCSIDDTGAWSVDFQTDFSGDIYGARARTNPQSVSVNTRFAMDDPGDWDWQERFAMPGSVTITGDTASEPWTAHVEASWNDGSEQHPIPLSLTVDVTCTEWYRMP